MQLELLWNKIRIKLCLIKFSSVFNSADIKVIKNWSGLALKLLKKKIFNEKLVGE